MLHSFVQDNKPTSQLRNMWSKSKARHKVLPIVYSPDPAAVSHYLYATTGSEVTIQPTDVICSTCYKLHVAIINDDETNCTMEDSLTKWRESTNESTDSEMLTRAVLTAVILVGEHLHKNKALLLPQVSRVFVEAYGICTDAYTNINSLDLTLELGSSTVKFFSRWVLNH